MLGYTMKRGRQQLGKTRNAEEAEELESLNASVLSKPDAPQQLRRALEADIEAKARKKRSREVPASAGFKRTV